MALDELETNVEWEHLQLNGAKPVEPSLAVPDESLHRHKSESCLRIRLEESKRWRRMKLFKYCSII